MPRIASLIPMDGGRIAVILEPSDIVGDPGCITLWTNEEKAAEIAAHVKMEREECAQIAERLGYEGDFDDEGSRIAKEIRSRL